LISNSSTDVIVFPAPRLRRFNACSVRALVNYAAKAIFVGCGRQAYQA